MQPPTPIYDSWLHFMEEVPAPDSFIEMSFFGMISAALQRRVFLGSEAWAVFPNMYVVLVGPPATGKGLAIFPTKEVLETYKRNDFVLKTPVAKIQQPTTPEDQLRALEALTKQLQQDNPGMKLKGLDALSKKEPLAIPIAAQASTYEAVVKAHADSLRTMVPAIPNGFCRDGMYTHSSMAFLCEEISSLFRKHTDDLVNYLVTAFDCRNYEYDTKNSGNHYVRNPCLNIIGGTQPSFLARVFKEQLLTEGFASRVIFVYEEVPRFVKFDFGETTIEKLASRQRVVDHIRKLITLFGRVELSPECHAYMKHMVEDIWPRCRTNSSQKLDYYYGRKAIHFRKLTMAIHFSENVEMVIQQETAERAVKILERLERRMDMALNTGGRNELSTLYDKVSRYIKQKGGATKTEIWVAFIDEIKGEKELEELITFLLVSNKVTNDKGVLRV